MQGCLCDKYLCLHVYKMMAYNLVVVVGLGIICLSGYGGENREMGRVYIYIYSEI